GRARAAQRCPADYPTPPPLPRAAVAPGGRPARRRGGRPHDRGGCGDDGADRCGDGGARGSDRCGPDRVRHGEGGRQGHGRDRCDAGGEDEGARLRLPAAVITVSDGVAAGEREDESGRLLVELLEAEGFAVEHRVVPDERPKIAAALREVSQFARLIVTTGGTGMSPRDFTPEATESVLDRHVPGIAEALRADAIRQTPHGLLGRGVAGV